MKFPTTTVQTRWASPLGPMVLAASPAGLVGTWFDGQRHLPDASAWPTQDDHPLLRATAAQLGAYFAGTRDTFDMPLDLGGGTPFQQAVWQALLRIPRGQTLTYGRIARDLQRPDAMRAVGAAVGRNPVSVIGPCHRVLGASGALTGYAGGLDRKRHLLALEGANVATAATAELF